jgi:hypothetical protein
VTAEFEIAVEAVVLDDLLARTATRSRPTVGTRC